MLSAVAKTTWNHKNSFIHPIHVAWGGLKTHAKGVNKTVFCYGYTNESEQHVLVLVVYMWKRSKIFLVISRKPNNFSNFLTQDFAENRVSWVT